MVIKPTLGIWFAVCSSLLSAGCAGSVNQWMVEKFPGWEQRQKSAHVRKHLKNPAGTLMAAARFHEHMGNLASARESYDLLLAENSKSTEAILGLARLDQLAGRSEQAEQGYLKALRLKPNDPHVLDATGQFYISQELWDDAQKLLNRAMLSAPANKLIRNHLAVALAKSGNTEAAMPHFVRAVGDAEAHYNVALVLHEQGKLDESEQHLLQAVIKKPELQQAQYWLDEVRREQEAKHALVSSQRGDFRYEEIPSPIEHSSGHFPSLQYQTPRQAAIPAGRTQSSNGFPIQGLPSPVGKLPTLSSDSSSAVPPNMTIEQLEQWKNQTRVN